MPEIHSTGFLEEPMLFLFAGFKMKPLRKSVFLSYGHIQNSVHGMWTFKKCKKFIFLNNS